MLIILLFLVPIHSSIVFTTIHLTDSSSFPTGAFTSLVLNITNATALTLHAVEPDTITGVQGKRLFAAPHRQFYSFELLHVTRVRSSLEAEDERTVAAIIRYSLPHEALLSGVGVMGVDSVGEADTVARWLTTAYFELPPFAAQYLVLGWALTVLGFLTCIACYCCWRSPLVVHAETVVASAIVMPSLAPAVLAQKIAERPPSVPAKAVQRPPASQRAPIPPAPIPPANIEALRQLIRERNLNRPR